MVRETENPIKYNNHSITGSSRIRFVSGFFYIPTKRTEFLWWWLRKPQVRILLGMLGESQRSDSILIDSRVRGAGLPWQRACLRPKNESYLTAGKDRQLKSMAQGVHSSWAYFMGSGGIVDVNQPKENLFGVAIRRGQDRPDEYGKTDGQDVKRGVVTTRLSLGLQGANPCLPLFYSNAREGRCLR